MRAPKAAATPGRWSPVASRLSIRSCSSRRERVRPKPEKAEHPRRGLSYALWRTELLTSLLVPIQAGATGRNRPLRFGLSAVPEAFQMIEASGDCPAGEPDTLLSSQSVRFRRGRLLTPMDSP